jgi:hypothetical protein
VVSGPESPADPARSGSVPTPFSDTPNAERFLLEADTLRRRQLRSALLHGSSRTWRDRRRIWPAVIAGIVLVAIISAAIAVYGAFEAHQRQREQQERERQERLENPQGLAALPSELLVTTPISWPEPARSAANS